MTQPGESDVELFAGAHGFIELESQYSATLGDHREWVHLSKVEKLVLAWDPNRHGRSLFAKLDVRIPSGASPLEAHDAAWRRVLLDLDRSDNQ